MSYVSDRDLPAKVEAVNESHRVGIGLYAALVKVFESLIGQKVVKADGTLTEKVKKLLPPLPNETGVRVWFQSRDGYSLVWGVSVNKPNSDGNAVYHEVSVYVGKLQGDTVTELYPPFSARTDYSVEQVKEDRIKAKAWREAYEEAKRDLYHFGE